MMASMRRCGGSSTGSSGHPCRVRLHQPDSGSPENAATGGSPSSSGRHRFDEFFFHVRSELGQQEEETLGASQPVLELTVHAGASSLAKPFRRLPCPSASARLLSRRPFSLIDKAPEQKTPALDEASGLERLRAMLPASKEKWDGFLQVVQAWTEVAWKKVCSEMPPITPLHALAFTPLLQALSPQTSAMAALPRLSGAMLPLKVAGIGGLGHEIATHIGLLSLASAVMFIGSIRGLNTHGTARQGNVMGMIATAVGIISVLASPGFNAAHLRFFITFAVASAVGYGVASGVAMEDMPQLVAGFHSFVGLAAVFAGFASYLGPGDFHILKAAEMFAGTAVGALTFTGSVVAAGKLHGVVPGRPIELQPRWFLNCAALGASLGLGFLFLNGHGGCLVLAANTVVWGFLGVNMVLPIGGADMPVVVSLLNAFSGVATSAAGFMLSNNLLTITGALVASSGTLLSDIMCRGINRSMYNVLLGGFGTDDGAAPASAAAASAGGEVQQVSALGFVGNLLCAKKVVIIPGYGVAVARCQSKLADIVALLRRHGVIVHFAIHPVAGRLPGHMNVLLAEANVPYDIVKEMDEVNAGLHEYDLGIVIGANDIVNPATQDDPRSPIYGMPAIEVWKCRSCVVLKRSMGTGYSGVDNPLFFRGNVRMLFGDAKNTVDNIFHLLEESQDQFQLVGGAVGVGEPEPEAESEARMAEEASYPPPSKVVGVLRERRRGERRVAITPSSLPKLRQMGFSVLMEAGAGSDAGFPDDDYVQRGGAKGVEIVESPREVLRHADVIFKVNEPLLEEIQVLHGTQTMIGFWNMYEAQHLLDSLEQSVATIVNLALVPRVSRAQKMDALTSMANIAGYRSVLDAFSHLPRFSRSSVTASGAVPPAKVFVIGAGVAGLSAIATAHAMGAKVYANDVRDAAREQVESMGAEFIPVDAAGIAGEGVGGYATEMSDAFTEAQLATYRRVVPNMDVVIATAMIPNRRAPVLITQDMVASMRRGSVVVDLAAPTGGNCALTSKDKVTVSENEVTILGETNYPSAMAPQASELLANNFLAMLDTLGQAADFGGPHWKDPIIQPAMVASQRQLLWPPKPSPVPDTGLGQSSSSAVGAAAASSSSAAPQPAPMVPDPPIAPATVSPLIQWLEDHKSELSVVVGPAVVIGLGLSCDIPEEELAHIGYFVLSLLIGHFTVAGVTPALHTPLISVTNAISGIIVVGGMLQLNGPLLSARVGCALAAVFLSSINIVGGFAVTQRMLEMFRQDSKGPAPALSN